MNLPHGLPRLWGQPASRVSFGGTMDETTLSLTNTLPDGAARRIPPKTA